MPPDRRITHSGPFLRNQLMRMNQYVASPEFPKFGRWDRSQFDDVYVVKGSLARTLPVDITIVCELSSDAHYLKPQGTYNSNYMTTPDLVGRKTKLQFTGQRPSTDPELGDDYDVGLQLFHEIQAGVSKCPERQHLVVGEQLRFNFNVFAPKVQASDTKDEKTEADEGEVNESEDEGGSVTARSDDSTMESSGSEDEDMDDSEEETKPAAVEKPAELYAVPRELQSVWREVETRYDNRIMPVYGLDRQPVPYTQFQRVLKPGTTVLVSFNLVHYAIKDDKIKGKVVLDCFVANVKEVLILNLHDFGPAKPPSTPKRKGRFVSQTPPSRETLRLAADTFFPSSPTTPSTGSSNRPTPEVNLVGPRSRGVQTLGTSKLNSTPKRDDVHPELSPVTSSDMITDILAALSGTSPSANNAALSEEVLRRLLPVLAVYLQQPQRSHVPEIDEDDGCGEPSGSIQVAVPDASSLPSTSDAHDYTDPTSKESRDHSQNDTVFSSKAATHDEPTDDFVHINAEGGADDITVPLVGARASSQESLIPLSESGREASLAGTHAYHTRGHSDKKDGKRRK